jgi:hypothetical protein
MDKAVPITSLAAFGFLVLFPGFFFYHTLNGLGLIPAFLGGFFRPMALVFMFVFCGLAVITKAPVIGRLGPAGWVFMLILAWITLSAAWHYLVGTQVGNLEMFDWSISGVFLNVTCYLVARHLPLRVPAFQVAVTVSLGLIIALVFLLARDGMFYLRAERLADEEKVATYQGFARSLAVTGIVAVAFTRRGIYRVAIGVATVAALYINGARAEFVCFIVALLALWSTHAIVDRGRPLLLVAMLGVVSLLPLFSLEAVQNSLPDNRMLQLFDLAGTSSAISRAELAQVAWEQVGRHPLMGNYGFYYDTDGVGGYPHSVLAAWVNLGLVGFILYIALFAVMTWVQSSALSGASLREPIVTAALLTLVFSGLALLFAKEYSYMVTAFAVAFTDRVWSKARYQAAGLAPHNRDAVLS